MQPSPTLIALSFNTPMPDQLAANQDVLDGDSHCAFINPPGSILSTNDMLENSRLRSNTVDHETLSPNHHTQPSVGPWTSGDSLSSTDHNHPNFTQGHYSTQSVSTSVSQALAIPPPQFVYSYSTTTNMLPPVLNHGSWNNTLTLHDTQYHNPVLGGASIGYSSSPAMRSGYPSPSISQMAYQNGHSLRSTTPLQYTVANHTPSPSIFDNNMSTSGFSPYNTFPPPWQTRAVPQPGHLSLPFTPMIPPPLAAESSRFAFVMQPQASHGEQIGYLSNQLPDNQPDSFLLHSLPSSPLLSCRWLNDDAIIHCGFTGTLKALKLHCAVIHFTGPKIARIKCHWEGCDYYKCKNPTVRAMRRDSLWRHICEIHFGLKRGSI
ncbi:uncharacterized protein BJ212DRAFT_1479986 [Suillus subaureus]|uniref:Uncharacterized protein n=1 Tax=Suillus subaureus TaxID=48587 RepID=A0A9P7EDH0_9AGAM|nr:uncharacterized protein BJ212DRAFT_1479986 [Suillus subaureus]KAG1818159.1 hypothetical protein BJ212DRAFT_1479986 [Suillus subaureus]